MYKIFFDMNFLNIKKMTYRSEKQIYIKFYKNLLISYFYILIYFNNKLV
jgi:hypothetical protein